MLSVYLCDAIETEGFEVVYGAVNEAVRGNSRPLCLLGIFGADIESARRLLTMIERAYFCPVDKLAADALKNARGLL